MVGFRDPPKSPRFSVDHYRLMEVMRQSCLHFFIARAERVFSLRYQVYSWIDLSRCDSSHGVLGNALSMAMDPTVICGLSLAACRRFQAQIAALWRRGLTHHSPSGYCFAKRIRRSDDDFSPSVQNDSTPSTGLAAGSLNFSVFCNRDHPAILDSWRDHRPEHVSTVIGTATDRGERADRGLRLLCLLPIHRHALTQPRKVA